MKGGQYDKDPPRRRPTAESRLGVRSVIENEPDIAIDGEADTLADGFKKFRELRPDVTILGLRLHDACTIDDLDGYFGEDQKARSSLSLNMQATPRSPRH